MLQSDRSLRIPAKLVTGLMTGLLALGFCFMAEARESSITDWSLGETLSGEEIDLNDVKGKVVVLEYWGVRCPPCIASLPHLAKLDRRYRDDGLVMIGAESQGHNKKQVEPILKKAKVEYTITKGARGPAKVRGIPHILVFDREGKKVYEGHPADRKFDAAVKDALKQKPPKPEKPVVVEPSNLLEEQEWTNAEGQSMSAAVRKANASSVTFLMPDGKLIEFPIGQLSEESKSRILEAIDK